uniref:Self-incompatibility protein S1 n=1 Tax=Papaver rhoeas TaxID=33128 RepID=S1_PAPRH|nr:RecName: Full=Self-incompatibility protein S1; Flags: Precursor [Papaver rhoeas]CAA52380.1 S1 self-incompatibility protein [Papaver rhoeas]
MNIFYVIVLLSFFLSKSSGFFPVIEVRIMNRRGNGRSIGIHCRSKDNDLQNQTVTSGHDMSFSFREDFFHTTHFYCDLQWDKETKFGFYSYQAKRDDDGRCSSQCLWKIMDDGLYGFDQEHQIWQIYHLIKKERKEGRT